MNIKRPTALVVAVLLVLSAVSPAFVGTAVAHHEGEDDNPLDEILDSDENSTEEKSLIDKVKGYVPGYLVTSMAALDGQIQRGYSGFKGLNPFGDGPPTNEEHAQEFAHSVYAYNQTYMTLVNDETTPSENYSTHKVTFAHDSSSPYTMYVVADIENESVASVDTYTEDEFSDLNETVDVEWVVVGAAAKDMDDLTADLAHRIEENKPVDESKQAQLAGKYCDVKSVMSSDKPGKHCDIRSDLWMNHDDLYEGVNESAS